MEKIKTLSEKLIFPLADGKINLPTSALTISFFNLTDCVGVFLFRLVHNTDELTIFYHMDPVHRGLTLLQEDFIAMVRSAGNAMVTGITGKG